MRTAVLFLGVSHNINAPVRTIADPKLAKYNLIPGILLARYVVTSTAVIPTNPVGTCNAKLIKLLVNTIFLTKMGPKVETAPFNYGCGTKCHQH